MSSDPILSSPNGQQREVYTLVATMLDGLVWEKWCFIDCLLGSSSETKSDLYLDIKAAGTLKCLGIQITTNIFAVHQCNTARAILLSLSRSQILIITFHFLSFPLFNSCLIGFTIIAWWWWARMFRCMMAWKMNVVPWMSLCLMVPFLIESKPLLYLYFAQGGLLQGWTRIMSKAQKRAFFRNFLPSWPEKKTVSTLIDTLGGWSFI